MSAERSKSCRGCDLILPEKSFYWDKRRTPWRRRARCMVCMSSLQIGRNVKRQEEIRVYFRQRVLRKKAS